LNINATLLGQVILIFIPIIVILSYYLGKRKTQTPKLATLIGFILAFIPPLALVYIAALVIKNDVRVSE
jgi:4-amino-4-deoxy-L-arabinose transferase-like glycosyltransferase